MSTLNSRENSGPVEAKTVSARLIQLDVLRGIAILMVVACHFPLVSEIGNAGKLHHLGTVLVRFGWSGVDMFFVLSGFLVGGLLFNEIRARGTLDIKRFLVRRAFKIWPLYYTLIAYWFVRRLTSGHSFAEVVDMYWPNLFHIQNYFIDKPSAHTWTLAVEEHFYLALPLVLGLALWQWRRKKSASPPVPPNSIPALPILAFSVLALCTLGRIYVCAIRPAGENEQANTAFYNWVYSVSHLRFDSLFFGVLLAYWHHFDPERLRFAARHAGALLLVGLILISPMIWIRRLGSPFVTVVGFNLLYLGYGAMLLAFIYSTPSRTGGVIGRFLCGSVARSLAFIGLFSYPIYLWHLDMGTYVVRALIRRGFLESAPVEVRWLACLALNFVFAILAGIFWSKVLEKPSLVLRDRFFPRLSPGALEPSKAAPAAEKPAPA